MAVVPPVFGVPSSALRPPPPRRTMGATPRSRAGFTGRGGHPEALEQLQLPLIMDALPFHYERGLHLSEADFWLDPHTRRAVAYVSHGHSDHCLPHGHAVGTPATAEFYRLRTRRDRVTELPFNQPHQVGDRTIELFPAGHILGASQVLVTGSDGRRMVYTGDFKLSAAPCLDAAEVRECEVLVMECTFGQPRYRFPSMDQIEVQLKAFVDRCLENDEIPVVLGYVLGKSQEALCLLARAGYTVVVHESIAKIAAVYERQGVSFGSYETLGDAVVESLRGKVVLCPPHLRKVVTASLGRYRTVMLSGWAVDPSARYRYGCHEMIALSDHADFGELMEYVERAKPKVVYTVHGGAAFSRYLREQGVEAHHLAD